VLRAAHRLSVSGARNRRRLRVPLLLVSVAALAAVAAIPAIGAGRPSGVRAAAASYLSSRYDWAVAVGDQAQGDRAELTAYVAAATKECAGVLVNPPHNSTYNTISVVLLLTLELVSEDAVTVRATRIFSNELGKIHWELPRLRGAVRALGIEEQAAVTVTPPALCPQLRSWARSDYRVLPKQTAAFVSRVKTVSRRVDRARGRVLRGESSGAAVLRLLERYNRRTARQVAGAEARVEDLKVELVVEALQQLTPALGF
jgi:hypothetical protein